MTLKTSASSFEFLIQMHRRDSQRFDMSVNKYEIKYEKDQGGITARYLVINLFLNMLSL